MKHKQQGFTLLELMVTLSIVATVSVMSYPSFQETIRSNRIEAETSNLLGVLMMARSEAVKLNATVIICRSDNFDTSTPTCLPTTNTNTWDKGWVMFKDIKKDGTFTAPDSDPATPEDEVIKYSSPTEHGIVIPRVSTSDFKDQIAYKPSGGSSAVNAGQYISICSDDTTKSAKRIFIDKIGRPRVEKTASCL